MKRADLSLYAMSATLAEAAATLGQGKGDGEQRLSVELKSMREDLIKIARAEENEPAMGGLPPSDAQREQAARATIAEAEARRVTSQGTMPGEPDEPY